MTRRALLALFGSAAGAQTRSPGRTYTVDAVILLFVIPIWKRSGVGRGRLTIGSRNGVFQAEFSGGAIPERANGVRNAGLLSETVTEKNAAVIEARYFGIMTTFKHETSDEAKSVLAHRGEPTAEYSVVEGVNAAGAGRCRHTQFRAAQLAAPDRIGDLLVRAQQEVSRSTAPFQEQKWTGQEASGTLLHSLWRFALHSGSTWYSEYLYGPRHYVLQAEKRPDRSVGEDLARAGLTQHPERIVRMKGRIAARQVSGTTPFTLWYEEGPSPNLLRLDWQPRAFLKLRFTAVPQ